MTDSKIWDRSTRAFVSWGADVASFVLVIALFAAWIHDLHLGEARFLSASFLDQGFCLSNVVNTQWACACFDFIGGFLMLGLAVFSTPSRAMLCLGGAAYTIGHGYGHYVLNVASTVETVDAIELNLQEQLLLSLILAVGPIEGAKAIKKSVASGKSNTNLHIAVAVTVLCLTGFFVMVVKDAKYSLLYINTTIILTSVLPRVLFIGYKRESDISFRVDLNYYFWSQICKLLVMMMVVMEPLFCDVPIRQLGGHLLFDAALFLTLAVHIMNDGKA